MIPTGTGKEREQLTPSFRAAIKIFPQAVWKIAARAEVNPQIIYRAINGVENFFRDDDRIKRVAEAIDFKGECFVMDDQQQANSE